MLPRSPTGGPNERQEQLKKRQERPKTAPRVARSAPRAPQEPPRAAQEGPRRAQESPWAPGPPRRSQESPTAPQTPPESLLGPILVQCWLLVGLSGASISHCSISLIKRSFRNREGRIHYTRCLEASHIHKPTSPVVN